MEYVTLAIWPSGRQNNSERALPGKEAGFIGIIGPTIGKGYAWLKRLQGIGCCCEGVPAETSGDLVLSELLEPGLMLRPSGLAVSRGCMHKEWFGVRAGDGTW